MPSAAHPSLLVTTPTGHTGRHTLRHVLAAGARPRVLVRDPAKLDPASAARCEVVTGDLREPSDLRRALDGVETAFFCVPQSPEAADVSACYRSYAEPFAAAMRTAGTRRIVAISGGDGRGPGLRGIGAVLREMEDVLATSGAAARWLRGGSFMENFFWMTDEIARAGRFAQPLAGNVPMPFVAAADIGAAAARLLLDPSWSGCEDVAAHGPENLTNDQAAAIAGEALGFPVRFQQISGEEYVAGLAAHGVGEPLARSLVEMFEAIAAGRDMGAPAARRAECPTTLRAWMAGPFREAVLRRRAGQGA